MTTEEWVAVVFGNDPGLFLMQYLASCVVSSQLPQNVHEHNSSNNANSWVELVDSHGSLPWIDDVGNYCLRHTASTRR